MNKKLKISLILVGVFILFLFILIMVFSISVNAAMPPHSTVEKLDLNEGIFEYYFENSETFEVLNKVLIPYNEKFGYETDREIKMGEGENEITAAIFDEEKIIIYCSFIEESPIRDAMKSKNIRYFIKSIEELTDDEYLDYLIVFVDELAEFDATLSALILPFLFKTTSLPNRPYRVSETILNIINNTLGYLSLIYLIYVLIHMIYSKIKRKNIKHIKIKIILSLISIFYLFAGGLYGIINCIFMIINSF